MPLPPKDGHRKRGVDTAKTSREGSRRVLCPKSGKPAEPFPVYPPSETSGVQAVTELGFYFCAKDRPKGWHLRQDVEPDIKPHTSPWRDA